jgi:hypothetical protein
MFTLALVGCSNDDFLTTQSDETKMVSFSIDTDMPQVVSKARDGYRNWATGDPTSFGAFGMYDRNFANIDKFFNNQEVTRSGSAWTYTPVKYWADYTWCQTFDFFGYMPYIDGAALTQGEVGHENEYTLSFPVELSDVVLSKANVAEIPLICHLPVHKDKVGDVINYEMDQVLTGFNLQFQMGAEMAELRDFVIKEVKVTGAAGKLPIGGNVSRTYTYNASAGTWSAGNVAWSSLTKETSAVDYTVPFVDHGDGAENDPYDTTNNTLRVGYSFKNQTSQWGDNFYTIPSADFTPTITVTYDVTVKEEDGTYTKTRENITSTIQFSSSYFTDYASGSVGKVHPIVVQIVPAYLFVLADADQRLGYLVIQD